MNECFTIYLATVVGILISILLPILRSELPKPPDPKMTKSERWEQLKPYIFTAAFSMLSAILIVANFETKMEWNEALIAGYAWDSTMQKMRGKV